MRVTEGAPARYEQLRSPHPALDGVQANAAGRYLRIRLDRVDAARRKGEREGGARQTHTQAARSSVPPPPGPPRPARPAARDSQLSQLHERLPRCKVPRRHKHAVGLGQVLGAAAARCQQRGGLNAAERAGGRNGGAHGSRRLAPPPPPPPARLGRTVHHRERQRVRHGSAPRRVRQRSPELQRARSRTVDVRLARGWLHGAR